MPNTISRSSLSIEPLRVPFSAKINGLYVNVSGYTVEMTFTASGVDPVAWNSGTWDTDTTSQPYTVYKAQCTPPILAKGQWDIWLRITGNGSTFVSRVGYLVLT